jgi:hypothetical protein
MGAISRLYDVGGGPAAVRPAAPPAGTRAAAGSTIAPVGNTTVETTPPDPSMAPLYELAEEARIQRSTAWRWLQGGELGEAKRYQGDRRLYVSRAAFVRALQAPRRRQRERGPATGPS